MIGSFKKILAKDIRLSKDELVYPIIKTMEEYLLDTYRYQDYRKIATPNKNIVYLQDSPNPQYFIPDLALSIKQKFNHNGYFFVVYEMDDGGLEIVVSNTVMPFNSDLYTTFTISGNKELFTKDSAKFIVFLKTILSQEDKEKGIIVIADRKNEFIMGLKKRVEADIRLLDAEDIAMLLFGLRVRESNFQSILFFVKIIGLGLLAPIVAASILIGQVSDYKNKKEKIETLTLDRQNADVKKEIEKLKKEIATIGSDEDFNRGVLQ